MLKNPFCPKTSGRAFSSLNGLQSQEKRKLSPRQKRIFFVTLFKNHTIGKKEDIRLPLGKKSFQTLTV